LNYLYLLALHIIFVVTWFAGLFYIVRLFIYHTEAETKPETEKNILQTQFKIMEKRLWYGITVPSMILTFVFGGWMVYEKYGLYIPSWLLLKLAFVFGLTLYHLKCGQIYNQLQKNIFNYSAFKLRLWNEVATLFLVIIIFIVVLKNTMDWIYGAIGLAMFAALLAFAVMMYKKSRKEKEELNKN